MNNSLIYNSDKKNLFICEIKSYWYSYSNKIESPFFKTSPRSSNARLVSKVCPFFKEIKTNLFMNLKINNIKFEKVEVY